MRKKKLLLPMIFIFGASFIVACSDDEEQSAESNEIEGAEEADASNEAVEIEEVEEITREDESVEEDAEVDVSDNETEEKNTEIEDRDHVVGTADGDINELSSITTMSVRNDNTDSWKKS